MKNNGLLSCVGVAVLMIGASVVGYFVNGLVLSQLWAWFVVLVFNAPRLTIPFAIGISMVVGFLTRRQESSNDGESTSKVFASLVSWSVIYPVIALGIGWVVVRFT